MVFVSAYIKEDRPTLAAFFVSALVLYAVLVYGGVLEPGPAEWASNLIWAGSSLAAGLRCLITARRQSTRQGRLGWGFLGGAALLWFAGILHLMGGMLLIPHFIARGTLGNYLYASFAPLFIVGLFFLRIQFPIAALTLRRFCELGIIFCTVLICALAILFEPLLQTNAEPSLVFFSILDPALLMTATLLALSALWLQGFRHLLKVSALLFAAVSIHTGSDILYFASVLGDPKGPVIFRLELLWVVAFALQYWAAFEQDGVLVEERPELIPKSARQRVGWEPLLPGIAILIGMLILVLFRHQLSQRLFFVLIPMAVAAALFLLLREWASERHSLSLLQDLRESNAFANHILAASPSVIFSCTPDAVFSPTFISGKGEAQLGFDKEWARGGNLWEARVHPDDLTRVRNQLTTDGPQDIPSIEYRLKRSDGSYAWVYQRLVASLDDWGRVQELVGSITDISTRKELEKQVQTAQRIEALGRLSGGIAHDFNNLLTSILGHVSLSLETAVSPKQLRENLGEIRAAGERAARLTSQLLAFSRKQPLCLKVLDLDAVVIDMIGFLRRLIGEDIRLQVDARRRPLTILGDSNRLEQILMNLIINAGDAMPGGGEISVILDQVAASQVPSNRKPPRPHALITVRDSGCGMDDEVREKLFEPFFTTKPVGHGTGLGLAIVHGIVRQHNGHIEVDSQPGRGATFRIYLPATDQKPRPASPVLSSEVVGGNETVLVVDDEVAIPKLVSRALAPAGYRVLTATTPVEALELAKRADSHVQLLLTDLVLPGMNGRELAKSFLRICPGARVVYMSGYSDDLLVRRQVRTGEATLLQKPLCLARLSRVLRRVLDQTDLERGGDYLPDPKHEPPAHKSGQAPAT